MAKSFPKDSAIIVFSARKHKLFGRGLVDETWSCIQYGASRSRLPCVAKFTGSQQYAKLLSAPLPLCKFCIFQAAQVVPKHWARNWPLRHEDTNQASVGNDRNTELSKNSLCTPCLPKTACLSVPPDACNVDRHSDGPIAIAIPSMLHHGTGTGELLAADVEVLSTGYVIRRTKTPTHTRTHCSTRLLTSLHLHWHGIHKLYGSPDPRYDRSRCAVVAHSLSPFLHKSAPCCGTTLPLCACAAQGWPSPYIATSDFEFGR